MSDHQIPSTAPNSGDGIIYNEFSYRIAHPLSSRLQIRLRLMCAPSCLPAACRRQIEAIPSLKFNWFLGRSGKLCNRLRLDLFNRGTIDTEYPELPIAPRIFRKVILPGMVYATCVPASWRILLLPDLNRAKLAMQPRSHGTFLSIVSTGPVLDRDPYPIVNDFSRSLILALYMISPSSGSRSRCFVLQKGIVASNVIRGS